MNAVNCKIYGKTTSYNNNNNNNNLYRAMAHATSHTAEVRVRFHTNPSGIFGGQSGTGTGSCKRTSVFPSVSFHQQSVPIPSNVTDAS